MKEQIYWLQQAYLPDNKRKKKYSNSNVKTCFSEEKLIKQFGPPLSTNPPISE